MKKTVEKLGKIFSGQGHKTGSTCGRVRANSKAHLSAPASPFACGLDLACPVHLKLFEFPSSSPNSVRFQAYVLSGEFICSFLPSSLFKNVLPFPALSGRIWRREELTISRHFILLPKHIWVWEPSPCPDSFPALT